MAATVGPEDSERTAMGRFGSGTLALLPWTKQMLSGLWEHILVLAHAIYYTFISGTKQERNLLLVVRLSYVIFVDVIVTLREYPT